MPLKRRQTTFAERFDQLVQEFGSRYRLSKASGVPESTLQQYAHTRSNFPPRGDILLKLARAGNVSLEWLATGRGQIRPAGILPGAALADVVMVELRDPKAALQMESILGFLPFSRDWLTSRLALSDPGRLMLLEAEQNLPPVIRQSDLLLIDRTAERGVPKHDGIFVLSLAQEFTIRQVHIRLDQEFLVSSASTSEKIDGSALSRLVVGEVVWRGTRL